MSISKLVADHVEPHQEREALKEREEAKRSSRQEGLAGLTELGYSRTDASRALHQAEGDVNRAYAVRT